MEVFYILNHWHWWALAALLLLGELLGPCLYFLAIGLAALVTGLVVRFMPELSGLIQLGLFIVLCAVTLGIAHNMRHKRFKTPPAKSSSE